jgi:nucleotide-binding universal stress UspA family protein
MPRGLIVVGVDGSENSRQALRWALEEARLRQARVRVVHAWWMYPMLADEMEEPHLTDDASGAVQKFVAETLGEQDDVEVEAVAVQGQQASAALVDAAKDAELLVVGSRGAGGFSSLLLGSVSQQCAQHAPCPVAIVRRCLADRHPQHDARAATSRQVVYEAERVILV